jgi:hypothetical protein
MTVALRPFVSLSSFGSILQLSSSWYHHISLLHQEILNKMSSQEEHYQDGQEL